MAHGAAARITNNRDGVNKTSRVRSGARYNPPQHISETMLSKALAGTGRFPEGRQFDLLKADSTPEVPDVRLYYNGDLSLLTRACVAIVGTREVSDAGRLRAARLARELVDASVVVTSGLAYGVDAAAHEATIEHGGKTIAVIGTPLDRASPSENAWLQERIYREHLLISQFAVGERTFRTNFPLRNRLMATMTDATVIIEAWEGSGTLHQAVACTNLKRWLFIARSVVDDPSLTWPKTFLKYETCAPLDSVADITSRIL